MGHPCFYILLEDGNPRYFSDRYGELDTGMRLLRGEDRYLAQFVNHANPRDSFGWIHGQLAFVLVDLDSKSVRFNGGEFCLLDPAHGRFLSDLLEPVWPGWNFRWASEAEQIADIVGAECTVSPYEERVVAERRENAQSRPWWSTIPEAPANSIVSRRTDGDDISFCSARGVAESLVHVGPDLLREDAPWVDTMNYTEQQLLDLYKHEPLSLIHLDVPAKRLYYWQFGIVVRLKSVFRAQFPDWEIIAFADSLEYEAVVGDGLSIPWKSAAACWDALRNNYWGNINLEEQETALIAASLLGLSVE